MLITLHKNTQGQIGLGPGDAERTIEIEDTLYEEIDYLYHKADHLQEILNRLYKEAVV